ncbi:2-dehydro-3-deoxyphosphooctonate aldolase (KDO 8-P synthase) [Aliiroseovarius halocynthiae]|uniref:2-dehydro-3-deoxyphosphooctonate aldolase n=1 Tax=Aliiroseovarius halocynthiae TaxID=985055 RepID=A0A545SM35_9RHOB|nr:3-deoxy-8-phosphooctulonate synthase [Aliiroseovarius halocynthiae]TQV66034.1 3-deoxy-8-phosphooctulonate synthase [Aliiroseovarius halocynthiae]SMR83258.1 2-dehydro-3-deoxyphosphooctonate aldolase (KDO 8-P synthase) [Aliiroseovarius halocynthiae]
MSEVAIGSVRFGNRLPLSVIAGPCQLESRDHALFLAERLLVACQKARVGFVFKASFDKANRTSTHGKRGPGMEAGLEMLSSVKAELGVPVLTDVHLPNQCPPVAEVADALQIPAFLCRQTDLLLAAAATDRPVNVKKGQFLAPWDMQNVVEKLVVEGNSQILLTERGTSFGYNTLVTDMRALPQLAELGCPVIMDATHAVQMPGGQGRASGGQREFAPVLARAAVAVGVAGVFVEAHQDPDNAPSDGPNMIPIDDMGSLLSDLAALDAVAKARSFPETCS